MEGLEPPHLAASDPKSDVSTNFTTSGILGCEGRAFNIIMIPKMIKIRLPAKTRRFIF
jgi:hypothetical protein